MLALLGRQAAEDVVDDALGQVGGKVGKLVGVQRFGGGNQLVAGHRLDQAFADRIRDFEQDLAVVFGLDQVPDDQAFVGRQRLEDVGDVGRVHRLQLVLQLVQVLLVHDVLDQVVARAFLPVHQVLDQLVPGEQGLHLGEALLQVFGIGQLVVFAHGAAPQ